MARELVMPKLGLTMTQGTVTKWYFNEGDRVKEGDILYEVETDKLTNKIAADTEGVLRKIFVHTGETVPVKSLLGIIGGEDEDISDLVNSAEKPDDKTEIETAEEAPAATEKEVTVNNYGKTCKSGRIFQRCRSFHRQHPNQQLGERIRGRSRIP
jgi:pyruvate/2-oxoglutarate dehydrogenase complex dihydrolipoamide acyltransferase (E2) component